jgi:hypothetical protein
VLVVVNRQVTTAFIAKRRVLIAAWSSEIAFNDRASSDDTIVTSTSRQSRFRFEIFDLDQIQNPHV